MGLAMFIALCCLGILIINPFLGVRAASCTRGWLQKQGNCYGYFDEKLSWDAAELECQSFGPGCHLASILSIQESALVSAYIRDKQRVRSNVWMGLHDTSGQQRRRWRWADESTFNYKAWSAHQPDNRNNNEHCVEVTHSSRFKLWNDGVCANQNAYVCKYQL
ncbi:C-type lectin BpLec-like [Ahaetulla prasina]|uniref:C-type lectin BpLec-like n=1 Tax=Ahaetulla prasina TaxID=499056 RepID=UPI002649B6D1|nr:C-type lectin BpLec-like [Ahaetulla prasina]